MSIELLLYGTAGCHLCDTAESLVKSLGNATWRNIDIADSDALLTRYGLSIPVVARPDGRELNWPFDAAALTAFLEDR